MLKNYVIKVFIPLVVVGLDMLTKNLFLNTNLSIIPGLIATRSAPLNTGGAWGILSSHLWVLILITVLFFVGIVFFEAFFKCKHPLYTIGISFVLGGTIGNFVDRIAFGGVRDFIFFPFLPEFPTFNVADSFLCIGTIILVIFAVFVYKPKGKKV